MAFNPQNVSYNKADIAREAAESNLSEGWYKFAVDSNTIKEDDSGNIIANHKVSPLDPDDGETRKRPSQYVRLTLPLTNPDRPDHVPPDWAKGISGEFLRGLDSEEIPAPPRRVDGVWQYQGEEIDADDVDEKKLESTEKLLDACTKLCKNPNLFKDYTFFGKITYTPGTGDNAGRTFVNIKKICAALPDGETLVPLEKFVSRGAIAEKPAKTAPTNGHAKTNGATKKTAKKS